MLNRRNLIILAAVVVALIAVSLWQRRSHDERTSRPSSETLLAGEFTRDDLGRVTVGFGDDPEAVVLTAEPDGWVVQTAWNAAANDMRIDTLLEALSGLRGEFRSDDGSVLPDYGFSDSTTVVMTGYDRAGAEVFTIEMGDKPERGTGCFVKRHDQAAVYLTNQALLSNLGLYQGPERPQNRHFLDLEAFKVDRLEVDTITLRDGDQEIVLEKVFPDVEPAEDDTTGIEPTVDRSTWEWRLLAPRRAAAAKTKVDGLLGTATSVRAQDVVDPGVDLAVYGLAEPARQAVLTLQGGRTVTLNFGDAHEAAEGQPGGVYFQVAGEPGVWLVGDYNVRTIFKSVDDLLPEE